jgi:hypothetical protein
MEKKILIFILLLIGNGIANAVEYPFVPSYNEHFTVEDYGSELVGSAERPYSGNWLEDLEDYIRMHGGIFTKPDPNWPSYVDLEYWEEFLGTYPEYQDEVKDYFEQHPNAPNNPFRVSLLDDTVGILILLLRGIAYLIYKFKFKKNEDFKN